MRDGPEDAARPWTRLQRGWAGALVLALTVLLALWGAFLVPFRVGGTLVPVSLVIAVVGNVLVGRAGARVAGSTGAVVPGLLWVALTLVLSSRRAEGDVVVLGARPGQRSRQIGYLPQRRAFDPATRVRGVDIVRLGLDGDRWGVPVPGWVPGSRSKDVSRRVDEVIELVGATSYARRPIGQCSGGEQQRVALARAIINNPAIILADETTGNLDSENSRVVLDMFSELNEKFNQTIIMITHNPEAAENCHRIIRMRDGQVEN